jgi:hypothetical protein
MSPEIFLICGSYYLWGLAGWLAGWLAGVQGTIRNRCTERFFTFKCVCLGQRLRCAVCDNGVLFSGRIFASA